MTKPLLQSRRFWLSIVSGMLSTLSAGLAPAGAPAWVVLIASSMAAGCAAGVAYLQSVDVAERRSRTVGDILAAKGGKQ